MPAPRDEVWGALWLIDAADAPALDAQEGVHATPPRYRREQLEVEIAASSPAGERVRCLVYRVDDGVASASEFALSAAYRGTMLRGARAFALPAAYVARLAALPVVEG